MNNYLSLNPVTGRLSKFAGGSRPIFTVGEQNKIQLYVIDFPKPITYPSGALSDGFSYSTESQDFNSQNITLRAGIRGGNAIISQSSLSNLPNNIIANTNVSRTFLQGSTFDVNISYQGSFDFSSIATQDSTFYLQFTQTSTPLVLQTPKLSLNSPISQINEAIFNIFYSLNRSLTSVSLIASTTLSQTLNQLTDTLFSYSYEFSIHSIRFDYDATLTSTINASNMKSNYGKYGTLDFTSNQWNTILGSKNESEIWLEAMVGGQTISQGPALITKKMT